MDDQPGHRLLADLGKQVQVVRGDVTQFEDVMRTTVGNEADAPDQPVVFLSSEHAPHIAMS